MRFSTDCPHGRLLQVFDAGEGYVVEAAPDCKLCVETGWTTTRFRLEVSEGLARQGTDPT